MVVRGITLNTKNRPGGVVRPLAQETKAATEHAKALSHSLAAFMAG